MKRKLLVSKTYIKKRNVLYIMWEVRNAITGRVYFVARSVLSERNTIMYVTLFVSDRTSHDKVALTELIRAVINEYHDTADILEIHSALYKKYKILAQYNFQPSEIYPDLHQTRIPAKLWWEKNKDL